MTPKRHSRRLLFRLRASQIRQGVDLRGDLVHWQLPLPLVRRSGSRWLEAEIDVRPGIYRYKFHTTDDQWLLDPGNERTWNRAGAQDSLLVVGGTDEPVTHAPVRPWIFCEDDGRICVRAALRAGEAERLAIRWDEGHGPRHAPFGTVAREGEHILLEAHVPASAASVRYAFELPDGRLIGRAGTAGELFAVELASTAVHTPAWWADAIVYTVFVDRFRRGGAGGRWDSGPAEDAGSRPTPAEAPEPRAAPTDEREPCGGDLAGLVEALPHLVELGVSVIHLTPIVVARSAHRYDSLDPRRVDDALGGNEALRVVLERAHELGLRILLDVTLTHVHRDFVAFRDVREKGPQSVYWDWFRPFTYPFREGPEPGYDHYQRGQWQEPLLRTEHPDVARFVTETLEHWTRLGVDGFRIDAAADLPISLLRQIRAAVRAISPDAVIFGELTVDNASRFLDGALDAATDFPSQQALYDWLWRRRTGAADFASAVAAHRFLEHGPGWSAIGLTATHDQPRLLTLVAEPSVARLGHVLQLTGAAVPAIYYGDEVGLSSGEPGRNFEDAWPDRCPMPWDPKHWDEATLTLFRRALSARRESRALRRGSEQFLVLRSVLPREDDDRVLLCVRRVAGDEVVDVLVNADEDERSVLLPDGAPESCEPLFVAGSAELGPTPGRARLGGRSALAIRRTLPPELVASTLELADQGRRLCALAFREGTTEALALPSHLCITVTEACNLRCRHCLNHSPRCTAQRTAREIRPWLVSRLGEALAAADHLAISHGGEGLVSPMLFDLLDSMKRQHQSRRGRYDVHLLSNGMLLTSDVVQRLVDHGVTSLAVSLDGASPETNDAIRLGGRFTEVVSHLESAVKLREMGRADLRIGLSTVVCEANVGELAAIGRLTASLGLDWLKIEELVPATAWARRNLLAPGDARLDEGIGALRVIAQREGFVLVEHVDPPTGCRCQAEGDEQLRAFRDADDFANRTRFDPCRAAWELACVDPDGLVHPVDYHHPEIGGLAEHTLLEIWDDDRARRIREGALHRFPEAVRRACRWAS